MGWKVSIRDKVSQLDEWVKRGLVFHITDEIINAVVKGRFPNKTVIIIHPQRWTNNPILLMKELVWQYTKNFIKKLIIEKSIKGINKTQLN